MFVPDRILTLDVGASKILLGEFSLKGGSPVLVNYAEAERDPLEASGEGGLSLLAPTVREMMAASGIKPAPLYLMLSGQAVFPRFVKIPGATADMADTLISAEAAESLPFPLDQVVWDYQTLDDASGTGELEALIVATKAETATDAAALAEGAGLSLALVDAAPLALCNAVRASLPENDESCTLALDIGAKATTLLFVEGKKVFLRTIPVAGNTVTNEIARGLSVSVEEAESLKKEIGFVALGGTYAVEDDERTDRVSKIIRNVATRLHSEITRSINFYRSQQGGNAPERVLLCGGSALTRHLDTFFREKLGVEVSYFDAFSSVVGAADALRADEYQGALFALAPSAGLALRAAGKAALEIDLVPAELAAEKRFRRRIPFLASSIALVLASVVVLNIHASKVSSVREEASSLAVSELGKAKKAESNLGAAKREDEEERERFVWLQTVAASRTSYAKTLEAVRKALLPATWVQSLEFKTDVSSGDSDGENSAGTAKLVVCGFKSELDEQVSGKGSAGELLLARLRRTPMFSGGTVEREFATHNDRVSQIDLSLTLALPPGVFDPIWIDPPKPGLQTAAPADDGDDDGED